MIAANVYKKAEHSLFTKYSRKEISLNRSSKILFYYNTGDQAHKKSFIIDYNTKISTFPTQIKFKNLHQIELSNQQKKLSLAFEDHHEASKWIKAIYSLTLPEPEISPLEPINEATSPKISSKDVADYFDLIRAQKFSNQNEIFENFDFTAPFLMKVTKYGPEFCEIRTIDSFNAFIFWIPQNFCAEKSQKIRNLIFSFAGKNCGLGGAVAAIWAISLSKYLKEFHQKFSSVKNIFENEETEEFAIFAEGFLKFKEDGEKCEYFNKVSEIRNQIFSVEKNFLRKIEKIPEKIENPIFYFEAQSRKLFTLYPKMPLLSFARAFELALITSDALNAQRFIADEIFLRKIQKNCEKIKISEIFTNFQILRIELSALSAELINMTDTYVSHFDYNQLLSEQVYLFVHQNFCIIWRGKNSPTIKIALAKALANDLNRRSVQIENQGMESAEFRSFVKNYSNKIDRIPPPKLEEIPRNYDIDVDSFVSCWLNSIESNFSAPEIIYEFVNTRYNVLSYSKKLVMDSSAAYAFLIPGNNNLRIHVWIGLKTHSACLIAFYKEVYPQIKEKLQGKSCTIFTSIQGDECDEFIRDLSGLNVSFNHSRSKFCLVNVQGPKIEYKIGERYKDIRFAVNTGVTIEPRAAVSPFIYHHYFSGLALYDNTLYIFKGKNLSQHLIEHLKRQAVRLSVALTIKLEQNIEIKEVSINEFCVLLELPVITFARIYSEEKSEKIRMASIKK